MNPDIDKAGAFDRKWSKITDKLTADEREMLESALGYARLNRVARPVLMLIAAVFGVAIGVAAMGLWG
jgi:hypothetical protein